MRPGLGQYKEILDDYERSHFIKNSGEIDYTTVVDRVTDILIKHGLVEKTGIQTVCGITVYPPEYFCPLNYLTGVLNITYNTVSIHHYTESWHSCAEKMITKIERKFINRSGNEKGKRYGRMFNLLLELLQNLKSWV